MKRCALAVSIALSLGLNANAATLELENRATWDTIITGATDYARFGNAMVAGISTPMENLIWQWLLVKKIQPEEF
jgi:hypothetical protein